MKPRLYCNIGISSGGTCNLRCPSCPVSETQLPRKHIEADLFRGIIAKLATEADIIAVYLFGHCEPLLNPHLAEYVSACNGLRVGISSNFSLPAALVSEFSKLPIGEMRVSVSGLSQTIYQIGHKGGDIDQVLANLELYAAAKPPQTRLSVLWHRYPHNENEREPMRRWCEKRKIGFEQCEAVLLPWEEIQPYFYRSRFIDRPIASRLHSPLSTAREQCYHARRRECWLQKGHIYIDAWGSVVPCCNIYDTTRHHLGSFMDADLDRIMARKLNCQHCRDCKACGAHVYAMQERSWPQHLRGTIGRWIASR